MQRTEILFCVRSVQNSVQNVYNSWNTSLFHTMHNAMHRPAACIFSCIHAAVSVLHNASDNNNFELCKLKWEIFCRKSSDITKMPRKSAVILYDFTSRKITAPVEVTNFYWKQSGAGGKPPAPQRVEKRFRHAGRLPRKFERQATLVCRRT